MKVVSVNIEKDSHIETVCDFVKKEQPDVLCMQEVMEDTVHYFEDAFSMDSTFVPYVKLKEKSSAFDGRVVGIATFTRTSHVVQGVHYYQGREGEIHEFHEGSEVSEMFARTARAVLVTRVMYENKEQLIGTTHFTYSRDGEPNENQRKALAHLLQELEVYGDLVLCGDFNIPRPNALYKKMCDVYVDNVPKKYESSLDSSLHRVQGLKKMVDYIWTKGAYVAKDVCFVEGVSDHCALIAKIDYTG